MSHDQLTTGGRAEDASRKNDERPWFINPIQGKSHAILITVQTNAPAEERQQIGRLIVAAPKLLAALEELLNYSGGADTALDDPYVVARARAAIARATGADLPEGGAR